jgi:hypothetical protein
MRAMTGAATRFLAASSVSGDRRARSSGDPSWIGIGYSTADGGLLIVIVATVLAWREARRGAHGPGGMGRAVAVPSGLLLVAHTLTIWAMTTKPG